MLQFNVHGVFCLTDPDGRDRRPKLIKSQALLAVLALIDEHAHTRSWFQNLLWEDRQHEQGRASLRSALSDIRRALGPYSEILKTNSTTISLDATAFKIKPRHPGSVNVKLLEGFDVPHASNFEDWLRQQRQQAESRRVSTGHSNAVSDAINSIAQKPKQDRVYITNRASTDLTPLGMQVDSLVDGIAKSLSDAGLAHIVDSRDLCKSPDEQLVDAKTKGCSYLLSSEHAQTSVGSIARVKVIKVSDLNLIWSRSLIGSTTLDLDSPATSGLVAELLDLMSALSLKNHTGGEHSLSPDVLGTLAIRHIFNLGPENFSTADALLSRAYDLDPKGRFLAWRAYLKTLELGELEFRDRQSVIDHGVELSRLARQDEPHNSMVLALCAQAEIMLTSRYRSACDLALRALEINRFNPLAWSMLGTATAFLGDAKRGHDHTQRGAKLARGTALGFKLESCAASTGILSGDFDGARRHAERAHADNPHFAPPLRYLTALYCDQGQYERAQDMCRALQMREPDFSFGRLGDTDYPSDSIRQAGLLTALPAREI